MTFDEMMKEKFQDLARYYDLNIFDFHVDHFVADGSVRFTIRGGGKARPRVVEVEPPRLNNTKVIKGGERDD